MNFLLDTSILIELENHNRLVIKELEKIRISASPGALYLSIFTYSEYYSGVINKS